MKWTIFLLSLLMLTGCKTVKYVQVPEYHTDTLYKSKVQRDSIYLHDSTYIREKGDTLLIERWHTKYIERQTHDTVYQSKADSIPVPYPIEKLVEKPKTWYEKILISLGFAFIFSILVLVLKRRLKI